jgi:hypothetical protein
LTIWSRIYNNSIMDRGVYYKYAACTRNIHNITYVGRYISKGIDKGIDANSLSEIMKLQICQVVNPMPIALFAEVYEKFNWKPTVYRDDLVMIQTLLVVSLAQLCKFSPFTTSIEIGKGFFLYFPVTTRDIDIIVKILRI